MGIGEEIVREMRQITTSRERSRENRDGARRNNMKIMRVLVGGLCAIKEVC